MIRIRTQSSVVESFKFRSWSVEFSDVQLFHFQLKNEIFDNVAVHHDSQIHRLFIYHHDYHQIHVMNKVISFFFDRYDRNYVDRFLSFFEFLDLNWAQWRTMYFFYDSVGVWDMCSRGLMVNRRKRREQIAPKDREKSLCIWKK